MPPPLRAYFFGVSLTLSCLIGCGPSHPPPVVPDLPDAAAASKAMELYDANHDGFLDAKELEKVPGLKSAIEQVDTNHDGKISEEEIAARIKLWADSKSARRPVTCQVKHNGKPLEGATVVFVPESFLGGAIQSGSGVTNAYGQANISSNYAADPSVKGVAPGFYRIQITKAGEKIPGKYNSETVLGAEVADLSEMELKGLHINLQY